MGWDCSVLLWFVKYSRVEEGRCCCWLWCVCFLFCEVVEGYVQYVFYDFVVVYFVEFLQVIYGWVIGVGVVVV